MRIFVAIDLPEDIKEKIYEFSKKVEGITGKFVEKENYHITLKFLGEQSHYIVKRVEELLGNVCYKKFSIEIKGVNTFGFRVLWLGIGKGYDELVELQNKVEESLKSLKFEKEKEYVPHITIARIRKIYDEKKLRNFIRFNSSITFGKFIIDKFSLKESVLTPRGPIYKTLKEYYLS